MMLYRALLIFCSHSVVNGGHNPVRFLSHISLEDNYQNLEQNISNHVANLLANHMIEEGIEGETNKALSSYITKDNPLYIIVDIHSVDCEKMLKDVKNSYEAGAQADLNDDPMAIISSELQEVITKYTQDDHHYTVFAIVKNEVLDNTKDVVAYPCPGLPLSAVGICLPRETDFEGNPRSSYVVEMDIDKLVQKGVLPKEAKDTVEALISSAQERCKGVVDKFNNTVETCFDTVSYLTFDSQLEESAARHPSFPEYVKKMKQKEASLVCSEASMAIAELSQGMLDGHLTNTNKDCNRFQY